MVFSGVVIASDILGKFNDIINITA